MTARIKWSPEQVVECVRERRLSTEIMAPPAEAPLETRWQQIMQKAKGFGVTRAGR